MADQSPNALFERAIAVLWDYSVRTVHARHNEPLEQALKDAGGEGWELIFMHVPQPNDYQFVLRRPRL